MDKVITAHHLTKKFGDFTAVNRISFEVDRGEIFGFLGANGGRSEYIYRTGKDQKKDRLYEPEIFLV